MVTHLPNKIETWFYKLGTNNSSQIATAILAGFKMFFIPLASLKDKKASPEQRRYAATRDFITEVFAVTMYTGITGMAQKTLTVPICKHYFARKAKLIENGKIKGVSLSKEEINTLKNVNSKFLNEVGLQEISSYIDKNGQRVLKYKASDEALEYVKNVGKITAKLQKVWKELPQNNIFQKLRNSFSSQSKIQNPVDVFKNTRINISQISIWILALSVIPALCNIAIKPVLKCMNKNSNQNNNIKKFDLLFNQHQNTFAGFRVNGFVKNPILAKKQVPIGKNTNQKIYIKGYAPYSTGIKVI